MPRGSLYARKLAKLSAISFEAALADRRWHSAPQAMLVAPLNNELVAACRLFGMPIALSFAAGFIMSAISPTVLVTGMLELQRRRYGEEKSALAPRSQHSSSD